MNVLFGDSGFLTVPNVFDPSEKNYAALIPTVLSTKITPKLVPTKFCVRNNMDPYTFTRDVFFLEVGYPFVSCILPLQDLEIEMVIGSNQQIHPRESKWIEETPLYPVYLAVRQRPELKRIALKAGDAFVYSSGFVYRICTPAALHLWIPICVEPAQQDLLKKVAHIPARVESESFWSRFPQQVFALSDGSRCWSSRFVLQYGVIESQQAKFVESYQYSILAPEWTYVRLTPNSSNTPNRMTFFEEDAAQKYVSFTLEQTAAFGRVFLTRPYWFLFLTTVSWILLVTLLIGYVYRKRQQSRVPPPPPSPPLVAQRRRRRRPLMGPGRQMTVRITSRAL